MKEFKAVTETSYSQGAAATASFCESTRFHFWCATRLHNLLYTF